MHHLKTFRWLLLVVVVCTSSLSFAQQTITWDQLTDVKFAKKFSAELGIELLEASFGPSVKALDGKEIIIKG